MTVIFESGYSLPGSDEPLTHARIAHAGNWLEGGTIAATTTDADYFEDAPDGSLTYEKWKPTSSTSNWDNDFRALGGGYNADYCVIGAHNLADTVSTITIQSWTGSTWQDRCPATLIADNSPIFGIFSQSTHERYRVAITGTGIPEIGVIKFGEAMQMQRAIYGGHTPLDMSRQTVLRSNYSETGESLGRTKQRTYSTTSFGWNNLTSAWIRANWKDFQTAIETEPFFIAWRPDDYGEVGLCQVDESPVPYNIGAQDLMAVEMQVRALGYD